jgi:hypothetical protein
VSGGRRWPGRGIDDEAPVKNGADGGSVDLLLPVGVLAGPDGGRRRRVMTRCSHVLDGGAMRLKEDAPGRRLSSSKTAPSQRRRRHSNR